MRLNDQKFNRLRILKAIRRAEPVARTDLVTLTGLPRQVVSELVSSLLERKLLLEERVAPLGRGRPRMALRINGEAACVLGAFLFPDLQLGVEIVNLRGERLLHRRTLVGRRPSLHSLALEIARTVDEAIGMTSLERSSIHSVGLGLPAAIDSLDGILHWLPGYPSEPVPFAAWIADMLGMPVSLDSGANVLTRADHWFGDDRQVEDFTLVSVGLGIGLGKYEGGLLHVGDHGINSQFAHLKVTPDGGPQCACGDHGCLMTYSSVSGILARISEMRGEAAPRGDSLQGAFAGAADDASRGDTIARLAFERAGRVLGTTVANYINLVDPKRVVIACDERQIVDLIEPTFTAALSASTLAVLRGLTEVRFQVTEDISFARGAAARVLEQLYLG